jgi:hypothetical protein
LQVFGVLAHWFLQSSEVEIVPLNIVHVRQIVNEYL